MSPTYVLGGLAASLVFLACVPLLLGFPPPAGEVLRGGLYCVFLRHMFVQLLIHTGIPTSLELGLLFILSMIRDSSLPGRINKNVSDDIALEEEELRRFGLDLRVHLLGNRLDVVDTRSDSAYMMRRRQPPPQPLIRAQSVPMSPTPSRNSRSTLESNIDEEQH